MNRKLGAWSALAGVLVAIGYAGSLAGSSTKNTAVLYEYSTAGFSVFEYAVILALVLWIAGSHRELLALRAPASWLRSLGIAVIALGVSLIVIDLMLDPFLHGGREQGLVPTHWEPSHAAAYATNWVVIAGVAPLVEELTYRGLGFSLLFARYGKWPAVVAVGLLFAGAHGLVQAFPELAVLGCALAWLRWRTQTIYPGVLVHAAFNSIALAYVFFGAH